MRIGASPSSPPPVGKVVVLTHSRPFTGTIGKSRRAALALKVLARYEELCAFGAETLTFGDDLI